MLIKQIVQSLHCALAIIESSPALKDIERNITQLQESHKMQNFHTALETSTESGSQHLNGEPTPS